MYWKRDHIHCAHVKSNELGVYFLLCYPCFSSLKRIPFFVHDSFFPSPPSSPQLLSYSENYVQILVVYPSPSYFVFPHTYDSFVICFIDFESVEKQINVACSFPLLHNMISLGFGFILDFFCNNLCTNAYIAIERFSFNVFFGTYFQCIQFILPKKKFLHLSTPMPHALGWNHFAFTCMEFNLGDIILFYIFVAST